MSNNTPPVLKLIEGVSTDFEYPRPLDGKARGDLESEVIRIAHNAEIKNYQLRIETSYLTIRFSGAADQKKFYESFGRICHYSLNNIFDHKDGTHARARHIKPLLQNDLS